MTGRVAGVLLAAGASVRFGDDPPKQLVPFGGEPLVRRVARKALESRLDALVLVVGFAAEAVIEAVAGLPLTIVRNDDWAEGQSTSVVSGLRTVSESCTATVFLSADQPWLDRVVLDRLVAVHEATGGAIVVPTVRARRVAPVLFARRLFAELRALRGDAGGRQLFANHPDEIVEVGFTTAAPFEDIDTPEDLVRLVSRLGDGAFPEA